MRERRIKSRYIQYQILYEVTDESHPKTRQHTQHFRKVYKFPNGYGASVIQGLYTHGGPEGLWEVGVLKFNRRGESELDYNTPVAGDVIGHLTWRGVLKVLGEIKELKKKRESKKK